MLGRHYRKVTNGSSGPAACLRAGRFSKPLFEPEEQVEQISQEQIRKDLVEILAKLAGLDPETIANDDRLREDLGLDSLQSMELLSRISDRYELDLDVEDVMDVESVGDVVSQLHGFMQASRAG